MVTKQFFAEMFLVHAYHYFTIKYNRDQYKSAHACLSCALYLVFSWYLIGNRFISSRQMETDCHGYCLSLNAIYHVRRPCITAVNHTPFYLPPLSE